MSFELCEFLPLLFLIIKSMFLFILFPLKAYIFFCPGEGTKKSQTPKKAHQENPHERVSFLAYLSVLEQCLITGPSLL